ncbi:transcription factor jun-D [Tachyglossus aculeatus]|uniref:transcription factor jun-D n=1 Tax=Tachyglossus aculeatus TaxID=9261 RepID=UPI0018F579FD|nr:transcription factor jun-D [Tachyglossus aculeatus]
METPFYHDDVLSSLSGSSSSFAFPSRRFPSAVSAFGSSMMKKDGLTLNLSDQVVATLKPAPPPPHGGHHLRGDTSGSAAAAAAEGLLTSPDLGLLKLASPELERLIIQSNGLVTTTPTSTQFLYPKVTATEEQEFAEGFVKALEDLHKQNQLSGGAGPAGAAGGCAQPPGGAGVDLTPGPPAAASLAQQEPPVYANLSSYTGNAAGALGSTTVNYSTDTVPYPPPPSLGQPQPHPRLQALKDEPQIVPDVPSFGESPPLSPIDMDTQERIKAERKRLRNRIAASKCRKRKLERISRLEEKVKSLKSQNTELASTANLLREQVAQLKQKVLSHVNSGCQLLPQHQVPAY